MTLCDPNHPESDHSLFCVFFRISEMAEARASIGHIVVALTTNHNQMVGVKVMRLIFLILGPLERIKLDTSNLVCRSIMANIQHEHDCPV